MTENKKYTQKEVDILIEEIKLKELISLNEKNIEISRLSKIVYEQACEIFELKYKRKPIIKNKITL